MYYKYGGKARPNNEAAITREMTSTEDALGNQQIQVWVYTLNGTIIGKGANDAAVHASVLSQLATVRAIFSVNKLPFQVYDLGDVLIPDMQLLPAQCINGPRIKSFSNPEGGAANYVNSVSYEAKIEGQILLNASLLNGQLNFNETISFRGNTGAKYVIRTPRNGLPVKQLVSQATPAFATQSGSSSAAGGYPEPPKPLWPDDLLNESEEITKNYADGKYTINWNYQYAAIRQLKNNPSTP